MDAVTIRIEEWLLHGAILWRSDKDVRNQNLTWNVARKGHREKAV
jgi:hypothetical protein